QLRQILRTEEEQHDEKNYKHVRSRKIEDTGDHWSHKHLSITAGGSALIKTILADLYSRKMICRSGWLADIGKTTCFRRSFFSADGIKRGDASLNIQMATYLSVLFRAQI